MGATKLCLSNKHLNLKIMAGSFWDESGLMIEDQSDRGASKEPIRTISKERTQSVV